MSWLDPDKRSLKRKVGNDISLRTPDIQRELYHVPGLRGIVIKVKQRAKLSDKERVSYLRAYQKVYSRRYRQVNKDKLRAYHRNYRRRMKSNVKID